MIRARDHKTPYLIDPWDYLGPKRRKIKSKSADMKGELTPAIIGIKNAFKW